MPVWHDVTRAAREAGELAIVGITQEQHPDRARLFAQWQGFDFPILWDPFNLTGSAAVPVVLAVDEYGRVQERPTPKSFEESFLRADFDAVLPPEPSAPQVLASMVGDRGAEEEGEPKATRGPNATRDEGSALAQFHQTVVPFEHLYSPVEESGQILEIPYRYLPIFQR